MAFTTIDDPSAYFQTLLYTGNGDSSQAQTNTGNSDLQPDWIWIKKRNAARNTSNTDSSRGFNKRLETQTTTAESTTTLDVISAQSNGFTVGNNGSTGENGDTYVAWQWKSQGGSTVSNSDGSITSTVQANTTAGFSIVQYVGTGSNGTIGHGLGVAPSWVLCKDRDGTGAWVTWQNTLAGNEALELQSTNAVADEPTSWNSTVPSSTVFSVGTRGGTNASSSNFVAYCFAEKQGYSKFGSYTGNGSLDGPFVYLGFKPAWVLIKQTSTAQNWILYDNKINPFNEAVTKLSPNLSDAEDSSTGNNDIDMLSNGFKVTEDNGDMNESGQNFIYLAFASSPFVSSEGVPTTAR